MVMIPIECPKCGRAGSVPSNRLNVALSCKSCSAPFYIDSAGEAKSGEPLVGKPEKRAKAAKKSTASGGGLGDIDFFAAFKGPSQGETLKKALMITVVLGLISGMFLILAKPKKDMLKERGMFVGKAFLDNDPERLRAVAYQDTAPDAVVWLEKMRSRFGIKGKSTDFQFSVDILSGSAREGGALLALNIVPLSPGALVLPAPANAPKNAPPSPMPPFVSVPMNLVIGQEGQWQLEGRQSLSTGNPRPR